MKSKMKIWSDSFEDGKAIPGEFAFAVIDTTSNTHIKLSTNRNPHFAWSGAPAGTKSFVLTCHDPDVPSEGEDVNKEGKAVLQTLPRVDFFHWVLIDLPEHAGEIKAATFSDGVTARGKSGPAIASAPYPGARQGINDYTTWFADDVDMSGDYFGYDGTCPPWNDAIAHNYIFILYALDIDKLPLDGKFTGPQTLAAMGGHILEKVQITGTYTLNPNLA